MSIAYNPGMKSASHAPTGSGTVLQLDDVAFEYRRGHTNLGPLTLSVREGEFVCVVGPSGSGKSTLLGLLAGFLKPERGRMLFNDQPLGGPHAAVTLVQQEHALFPWRTVLGNVEFGLEVRRIPRDERRERAVQALRLVGMEDYAARRVHELSGGQRQRVSIARALAIEPMLLLMDEPFSALDVATRNALGDELVRLWRQTGKTVLFVTHNLDEALRLGQRVVALRDGQVALDAPARELTLESLRGLFS